MKRLSKFSKKGLSIAEMILVVAIIVILASVLLFNVGKYLKYLELDSYKIEQTSK